MLVSEIFVSFQGEGPTTGERAAFLRLGMCNLQCAWCDSAYTWNWEKFDIKKELKNWTSMAVVRQLLSYKEVKRLIVTGGEPLLHQDREDFQNVLLSMKREKWQIEVETNGTIKPNSFMVDIVDQWNVSPKMANAGNDSQILESEALTFFTKLSKAHFKLVVEKEAELGMVQTFILVHRLPLSKLFLMPQARTKVEIVERLPVVQEMAKSLGCRFTTRKQIEQYGSRRGV